MTQVSVRDLVRVKHEDREIRGVVLAVDDGMLSIQIAPRWILQIPEGECEKVEPEYYGIFKTNFQVPKNGRIEFVQPFFGKLPYKPEDQAPTFPERPEGVKS